MKELNRKEFLLKAIEAYENGGNWVLVDQDKYDVVKKETHSQKAREINEEMINLNQQKELIKETISLYQNEIDLMLDFINDINEEITDFQVKLALL